MKMSAFTRFGVVTVLGMAVAGLAACGGDDGGTSAKPLDAEGSAFATALASTLSEDSGLPFDQDQAMCIANGVVNVIGVDAFVEAGMSAEDVSSSGSLDFPELTDAQTKDLAAIFLDGDCVDMGQLMSDLLLQQSSGSLTAEQAQCLGDGMAKSEPFADALAAGIAGDDTSDPGSAMTSVLVDLIGTCDVPMDAFG